ncbi:MAG: hypothetical protein V3T35_03730, partial [Spirochaetia bacterium]
MNVLVFSRNRTLPEKLKLRRRKGLVDDVSFVGLEQFLDQLKAIDTPTLCYLDLSGIEEKKIQSYLRALRKQDNIVFGIIDPTGKIKDVAGLFHDGAVDYLNRHTLDGAVGVRRLTRIREFVHGI